MDILVFAAIAFFIFFKLSKQLGKIDEEEKKQIEEKIAQHKKMTAEVIAAQNNAPKDYQEKIVGFGSTNKDLENSEEQKIISGLNEATKINFLDIIQRCNITAEFFINGVKSAFEMVLKAFATEDSETLKFLLSEKIYLGFENAINQRKNSQTTLITNLIAIEKAEIISASVFENIASVVMKINSKQINYISNNEGKIIEGRKDEIAEI